MPTLTTPESDLLRCLQKLENSPWLTMASLFFISFCANLLYVALKGWPLPSLHDEFSYLLAADTFASGHLRNPASAFFQHFETFHVLQNPFYASKYPPMQGMFLALGQCLGHPALGVFAASSLAIAVSYWSLKAIFPHLWALFGSFLIWLQLAPYTVHSTSYMGGSTAALGSCLLLGAAIRICQPAPYRISNTCILITGVGVLAASRPYEGLILSLCVALLLGLNFAFLSPARRLAWIFRVFLPGTAFLIPAATLLLFYNHAVTGHALTLPYSLYENTHSQTPIFVWSTPRTQILPATPNLHKFERDFTAATFQTEKAKSFFQRFAERWEVVLESFTPFWFFGTTLLLFSAFSARPWVWFCWLVLLFFMTACSGTVWFYRHYLAGLFPFLAILWVSGAQNLLHFRTKTCAWGCHLFRLGLGLLLAIPLCLMFLAPTSADRAGPFAAQREQIRQDLLALPGDDLVLVTYFNHSRVEEEWVYNRANIDRSEIIWAHDLGPAENEKLLLHFSNRRIWHLQVKEDGAQLTEIPPSRSP